MLKYSELQKNKTKVLLPNGCTGVVTEISPIKTMQGGLLRGRDKVKVAYTTKRGNTEAWFQLRDLRAYKLVPVKVNTDIQPVPEGKESWKSEDTYNGVEIVRGVGMTKDVIVPDVIDPPKEQKYDGVLTVERLNKSLKGINTSKPSINDLFDIDKCNNEESN